ncbi:hypothetical protein [Ferruginibacter sp.]
MVAEKYINKDFTFVAWGDWDIFWDKKRAVAPSWLDELLSFLLGILPILLVALFYSLITAFSE